MKACDTCDRCCSSCAAGCRRGACSFPVEPASEQDGCPKCFMGVPHTEHVESITIAVIDTPAPAEPAPESRTVPVLAGDEAAERHVRALVEEHVSKRQSRPAPEVRMVPVPTPEACGICHLDGGVHKMGCERNPGRPMRATVTEPAPKSADADGTLHDRIHPASGRLLHASPVLPPPESEYERGRREERERIIKLMGLTRLGADALRASLADELAAEGKGRVMVVEQWAVVARWFPSANRNRWLVFDAHVTGPSAVIVVWFENDYLVTQEMPFVEPNEKQHALSLAYELAQAVWS